MAIVFSIAEQLYLCDKCGNRSLHVGRNYRNRVCVQCPECYDEAIVGEAI